MCQSFLHADGMVDSIEIALLNRSMEQEVAFALSEDSFVQSHG
jgi:hypothetical protein